MFMNLIAVFATLIASLGTSILVFRAANRRIQLLAVSVGLLSLCQAVLLADKAFQNVEPGSASSEGLLSLSAGALSLAVVHLLNRENKDRHNVDTRIRCYEPDPAADPAAVKPDPPDPQASERTAAMLALGPAEGAPVLTGDLLKLSSQQPKPADRRRSRRYRVAATGDFRVAGGGENYRRVEVQNISRTGFCFESSEPAELGDHVVVRLHGFRLQGVVARCIPVNGGFQCGVELDSHLRTGKVAELLRRGLRDAASDGEEIALNG